MYMGVVCVCRDRDTQRETERFILRITQLWNLASPKSARWAVSLDTQEELILQLKVKVGCGRISSFLREVSLFLLRPSTDWMMSTHIVDGNLLYSKSTDLNVNLIFKNTFTETSVIMFDRISGYCDQAILMEKKKKKRP